jgi:cell division protein FtsL
VIFIIIVFGVFLVLYAYLYKLDGDMQGNKYQIDQVKQEVSELRNQIKGFGATNKDGSKAS